VPGFDGGKHGGEVIDALRGKRLGLFGITRGDALAISTLLQQSRVSVRAVVIARCLFDGRKLRVGDAGAGLCIAHVE